MEEEKSLSTEDTQSMTEKKREWRGCEREKNSVRLAAFFKKKIVDWIFFAARPRTVSA